MSAIAGIIANVPEAQLTTWLQAMLNAMGEYRSLGADSSSTAIGAAFHSIGHTAHAWQTDDLLFCSAFRFSDTDLRQLSELTHSPQENPRWQNLLPQLFQRYGPRLSRHLYGDYALAVWQPQLQHLFLSRDSSGIKPLYYALLPQQNGIAFASSLKALLALPILHAEVDLDHVAKHLVYPTNSSSTKTDFKNIHILAPGGSLTFQNGRHQLSFHWKFDQVPPLRYKDPRDYQTHFAELLTNAISDRVEPAMINGSHISGGADSTTVTLLAQQALRQRSGNPLIGYTWSPPAPAEDLTGELQVLRGIERKFNLPIRYCDLTAQEVRQVFLRNFFSEPTETLQSEFNILKKAQADGVRVMLSGWGGDEVVSANPPGYTAALFLRLEWAKLIQITNGLSSYNQFKKMARSVYNSLKIMNSGEFPFHHKFNARKQYVSTFTTGALLQAVQHTPPKPVPFPSFRYYQKKLWENGHIFNRVSHWDRHGASFGLEYRYPLLDRRLLEYVISIPFEVNYPYPTRGKLIREVLSGFIGSEQAFSKIKREDYRQPIFQNTIAEGFQLMLDELPSPEPLINPLINAGPLYAALKKHRSIAGDFETNRILRNLLALAKINFSEIHDLG